MTHSLTNAPPLDIMIIPGPPPVAVSCRAIDAAGIFLTVASGVLNGRVATTPLAVLPMLRAAHPQVEWAKTQRFDKSAGTGNTGDIWASGSVANGVDLAYVFIRERFPESRTLVDLRTWLAGIGEREPEFSTEEKALDEAFSGASSALQ
ncbi:transcriptional regulator [Diplodia corticola]|uniref:Transcriptional regulator n=1 Tax=Diplodia corticola TaxID=236234 RepID=A0A1J9R0S1_9PEZI|nr:transcriptional regulator [Diplodia corticola]OJD34974.1 transcriptional regulator [Diplodia corticola]